MKREIKVRMWNGTGNRFHFGRMAMECLNQQNCGEYDHEKRGGAFFEQFTGLLDKNGVEIYEGDVVRNYTDFNLDVHGGYVDYQVVYRNGCWMTSYLKSEAGQVLPVGYTCGSILEVFQSEDQSKEFYFTENKRYNTLDALEVVGNIHESSELLANGGESAKT